MIMNKYIQRLINEQFNISDLDFTDTESEYDNNIFNKQLVNPHDVYNKIVNFNDINKYEIEFINDLVSEVTPKDYAALHDITDFYSANYPEYSMNWLNVSGITKMETLFDGGMGDEYDEDTFNNYNGDISTWDTSNVTNMHAMFCKTAFTGNISNWDVSNVTDMSDMFHSALFTGDISNWDVSNVTNMCEMFEDTHFNNDISRWDVSNVTDMMWMFAWSDFTGDISNWDVSNVTNMSFMFMNSRFNGDISRWDVSNVTTMRCMFMHSSFNQNISEWDVSKVEDLDDMFMGASFNQDISKWNLASVERYRYIFNDCPIKVEYMPRKNK